MNIQFKIFTTALIVLVLCIILTKYGEQDDSFMCKLLQEVVATIGLVSLATAFTSAIWMVWV